MDWKIFLGTFGLVFLAELGDKTQLTALAFSAGSKSTWAVFFGACSALILSTLIAVILGSVLHSQTFVPLNAIKIISGVLFLVFGVLIIKDGMAGKKEETKVSESITKPGILVKSALNAAAQFEDATSEYYLSAAKNASDPKIKELFEHIAEDEKKHIASIQNLFDRNSEEIVFSDISTELPKAKKTEKLSEENLLEHFIKTEYESAKFYQELSNKATLPSLKKTFAKLAEEEFKHEKMLRRASKT